MILFPCHQSTPRNRQNKEHTIHTARWQDELNIVDGSLPGRPARRGQQQAVQYRAGGDDRPFDVWPQEAIFDFERTAGGGYHRALVPEQERGELAEPAGGRRSWYVQTCLRLAVQSWPPCVLALLVIADDLQLFVAKRRGRKFGRCSARFSQDLADGGEVGNVIYTGRDERQGRRAGRPYRLSPCSLHCHAQPNAR